MSINAIMSVDSALQWVDCGWQNHSQSTTAVQMKLQPTVTSFRHTILARQTNYGTAVVLSLFYHRTGNSYWKCRSTVSCPIQKNMSYSSVSLPEGTTIFRQSYIILSVLWCLMSHHSFTHSFVLKCLILMRICLVETGMLKTHGFCIFFATNLHVQLSYFLYVGFILHLNSQNICKIFANILPNKCKTCRHLVFFEFCCRFYSFCKDFSNIFSNISHFFRTFPSVFLQFSSFPRGCTRKWQICIFFCK